jgi:hypothetical protein
MPGVKEMPLAAENLTQQQLLTAAARLCVSAAVATLLLLGLAQAHVEAVSKCRLLVPTTVQTGTAYEIRGRGFAANRAVTVVVAGGGTKQNVSVQSDTQGDFRLRLAAAYGHQGRYSVSALDGKGKGRCVAKATYNVTLGARPTPTPTLPPLPVATTSTAGDDPAFAIIVAALLGVALVAGIAIWLGRWRKASA